MKKYSIFLFILLISSISVIMLYASSDVREVSAINRADTELTMESPPDSLPDGKKGCVFKTVFEGEGVDPEFRLPMPEKVLSSSKKGLDWLVQAQHESGLERSRALDHFLLLPCPHFLKSSDFRNQNKVSYIT